MDVNVKAIYQALSLAWEVDICYLLSYKPIQNNKFKDKDKESETKKIYNFPSTN